MQHVAEPLYQILHTLQHTLAKSDVGHCFRHLSWRSVSMRSSAQLYDLLLLKKREKTYFPALCSTKLFLDYFNFFCCNYSTIVRSTWLEPCHNEARDSSNDQPNYQLTATNRGRLYYRTVLYSTTPRYTVLLSLS